MNRKPGVGALYLFIALIRFISCFAVPNYVIVGVGSCTLNGYAMKVFDQSTSGQAKKVSNFAIEDLQFGNRKVTLIPIFGDGDGIVPLWSAHINGATMTWFIKHLKFKSAEHAALPGNESVKSIIGGIASALNDDTQVPSPAKAFDPASNTPMKQIHADGKVKLSSQCSK